MRTPCAWGSFWDNCRDKCPTNLLEIFSWISARIIHDGYRMGQMQGINGTNTPRAFSRMICGAAFIPILIPFLRRRLSFHLSQKKNPNRTDIPPDIYPETIPTTTTPKTGRSYSFLCVVYRFRVGRTDLRNLWKRNPSNNSNALHLARFSSDGPNNSTPLICSICHDFNNCKNVNHPPGSEWSTF